jgi:acetyl-CoA acetyltransferase
MHAVGATGIFQATECLWQLQQKYDKFHGDPALWKKWGKEKPNDWQSLQIPATGKQALWVSHAGVGSHVTVGILRKAW